MPPFRFEQCLRAFTMLLLQGYCEIALFRYFLDFGVRNFWNTLAMRFIMFWKFSIFNLDIKTAENKSENVFCFWYNYIWIGCVKLSLLRREYFSSAVNVLKTVLRFFISLRVTFSNSISSAYIHQYSKGSAVKIWTVFERG